MAVRPAMVTFAGGTAVVTARRCYACDQGEAAYEAHLDHDATPAVLLCDACAITEREGGSVVRIRTLAGGTPHVTAAIAGDGCRRRDGHAGTDGHPAGSHKQ